MSENIFLNIIYLIASVLFIIGIKRLGSPKTARTGNLYSSVGMLLAIIATLLDYRILTYEYIIAGFIIGATIGAILAIKVQMTAMPQMVGLLNGFGGGASTLVALAEYHKLYPSLPQYDSITITFSIFIGAITFTGSLVAFGKLQGILSGGSITYKFQHPLNLLLIILSIVLGVFAVMNPEYILIYYLILIISLTLGILLVIPIGGADMPVVISLLNSYSGIAASATGFVLGNNMLIITGALVGASGIILTNIMCKAMNRSLMNVLLGGWGTTPAGAGPVEQKKVIVKSVDPEEAALIFDAARSVIIVPGYGMAVAQAQHAVRDLANVLSHKGIEVRYAIHPVAGRMPGHMNVLLAEADVPYDKMFALEEINNDFSNTDISLIIGANDVVNPAARHDKNSPIYGMPILNVDHSKTVIINKRSMNPGYAGIDNELFGFPNALMYFGDAKDAINKLTHEIKAL